MIHPSRRQIIWIVVAIVLLSGIGFWVYRTYFVDDGASIMTAKVTRGNVEETVLATGTLKPSRLVAVGAQVSGRVTSLKVRVGDQVKVGDLVAEIDSVPQENDLKTAEATLANIRAQRVEREATLRLAQQTFERQKRSLAMRAVSQADYDAAEADLNTTVAQIEALDAQINEAQVRVDTANVNLGYTRITAPIDGTVLSVVTQEGQTVNAVQSAPTIVILGQLTRMSIRVEISEVDVVKVTPGQPIYFTILGDTNDRYEASLDFIEPAPESIKNDSDVNPSASATSSTTEAIYYNGVFTVPNPEGRLRTYMTAEVRIVLGQAENALIIPSSALGAAQPDGTFIVRVVEHGGKIVDRAVTVGLNDKIHVEVLSGLTEGEEVVIWENTGEPGAAGPTMRRMPMRL